MCGDNDCNRIVLHVENLDVTKFVSFTSHENVKDLKNRLMFAMAVLNGLTVF